MGPTRKCGKCNTTHSYFLGNQVQHNTSRKTKAIDQLTVKPTKVRKRLYRWCWDNINNVGGGSCWAYKVYHKLDILRLVVMHVPTWWRFLLFFFALSLRRRLDWRIFLLCPETRPSILSIIIQVVGYLEKEMSNHLYYDTKCTRPCSQQTKKNILNTFCWLRQ